jgi:hypothetical protein
MSSQSRRMSAEEIAALRALWDGRSAGEYVNDVARRAGVDRSTVYRWCDTGRPSGRATGRPTTDPVADPADLNPIVSREEDGKSLKIEFTSDTEVVTLADVIARAGADMTVWRVVRFRAKAWTGMMRVRTGVDGETGKARPDQPHIKHMWLITAEFERAMSQPYEDACRAIYERMATHAPSYRPAIRINPREPFLLIPALTDCHFGKLAWRRETGEDYDLKIAETRFRDALTDLLDRAAGYEIGEIAFILGSDAAHVDNQISTTTAGTFQDADGRLAKIVETIEANYIWGLELLAEIAPVKAYLVQGNHDFQTSYHVARTVAAWFRNHPEISIDSSPTPRKYHRYGTSLIGMTHGNNEKRAELPIIMATERPRDWAETTSREWLVGHEHRTKVTHSTAVDGNQGVVIRTIRSLSGRDFWHNLKGYVANDQSAEAYLYSKSSGYAGHFLARPRPAVA